MSGTGRTSGRSSSSCVILDFGDAQSPFSSYTFLVLFLSGPDIDCLPGWVVADDVYTQEASGHLLATRRDADRSLVTTSTMRRSVLDSRAPVEFLLGPIVRMGCIVVVSAIGSIIIGYVVATMGLWRMLSVIH